MQSSNGLHHKMNISKILNKIYYSDGKFSAMGRHLKWSYFNVFHRTRICKRLRSPGIYSKESIPPAYVAGRVCTTTLFVSYRRPGYGWRNRFLGSFKFYQSGLSHINLALISSFSVQFFLFFLWNLFHCHAPFTLLPQPWSS